jgi:tetratricopeptide (TPR) repeat protein
MSTNAAAQRLGQLARELEALNRIDDAILLFEQALHLDPEGRDALAGLIHALAAKGRHVDALRHLLKLEHLMVREGGAAANFGDLINAAFNQGLDAIRAVRTDEAEEILALPLDVLPHGVPIWTAAIAIPAGRQNVTMSTSRGWRVSSLSISSTKLPESH